MDIADYIIELLQRQETAVVPGLGSFHTSRAEGYYNKEQQLFYPPSLQAQFSKEIHEGTDLVELIAERRQISAASARYFIEKFVTSVKEHVGTENVPLGNMGVFTTKRGELTFEPNSLNESYELHYGLMPVKLKRSSAFRQEAIEAEAPKARSPFFEASHVVKTPAPVEPEPEIVPEPVVAEAPVDEPHIATPPVQTVFIPEAEEEAIAETEEEEKRGTNIWLILSIIIVLLGVGVIGLYKYKPELFSRFIAAPPKVAAPKPPVKKSATDSLNKVLDAQRDSAANKPDSIVPAPKQLSPNNLPTTAVVDTFGVVIATLKTPKSATIEAQRYIKKGFPQTEVHKRPNSTRAYQITVGTYFNIDSAQANRLKLLERLGLPSNEIIVQKYPYKKP
jgi:hypothetical protein